MKKTILSEFERRLLANCDTMKMKMATALDRRYLKLKSVKTEEREAVWEALAKFAAEKR